MSALSGEDKVIFGALGIIGILGVTALVALIFTPSSSASIIPVLSVTIAAISVLASRHPPTVAVTPALEVQQLPIVESK